ncbi:MAG TPA: DUF4062 domain-containing protein [Solirubrobacterales bacterium]|nr:DUF4062 domain-containing protein [Solirubrobacterales bacterium]
MTVLSVFLSSPIIGFEGVRDQAAQGIRNAQMHAVRSEEHPAGAASPRRALLDQVAGSDLYMLLIGDSYGDYADSETSPTEEEFLEAQERAIPTLVLVQNGDLEPRQRDFLDRIRGGWGKGLIYGHFDGAADVAGAVTAAITRQQAGVAEDIPAAQARALELARGPETYNSISSGVAARVAFVPTRPVTLLDALALDDERLGEELAAAMRSAELVPQAIGIAPQVSGDGVRLEGSEVENWTRPGATILTDGSIVVVGTVAAADGGHFGTMIVDPDQLEAFLTRAGRFAELVWERIDQGQLVAKAAVAAAIPEAQHKGFGASSSSAMSIGSGMPATVVTPDPPEVVPRSQLARGPVAGRVVAAIKRVFADADALQY